MTADGLAAFATRTAATMVLTLQGKGTLPGGRISKTRIVSFQF